MPRSEYVWSSIFTPQYMIMAWCLVKHRDQLYLYLYAWGWCLVNLIQDSAANS